MKRIPPRPDIGQLKKQAKELLASYRNANPKALQQLREYLPSARGQLDQELLDMSLRLHDSQSCIARSYGFPSWDDLQLFVQSRRALIDNPDRASWYLLCMIYSTDVTGNNNSNRPAVALKILTDNPDLIDGDPYLACAIGDINTIERTIARNPDWVNLPGGPLNLPPLLAVTHSSLRTQEGYRKSLQKCASILLQAGASPNQSIGNRMHPGSVEHPNEAQPLSALYGAAGKFHDPYLTKTLLDAGAEPNDGESLYHSLEVVECTKLLLDAGARITGTNAIYRALDLPNANALKLLLEYGGNANEPPLGKPTSDWGSPLLWAIRRRASIEHIQALLSEGAYADAKTSEGISAYTLALRFGRADVAEMLIHNNTEQNSLSETESFVSACASGNANLAHSILTAYPNIFEGLTASQLRMLPELAGQGCTAAVKTMVSCGWPIEVRGGDIEGSALNQAVFRGDAELTHFLLAYGADWRSLHGYGDNVLGTLSWSSLNQPVDGGNWVECARALFAHVIPSARPDPNGSDAVLIAEKRYQFSDEVEDVLLGIENFSQVSD